MKKVITLIDKDLTILILPISQYKLTKIKYNILITNLKVKYL